MFSERFRFRLYVSGHTEVASAALANLRMLCREHLPDRHTIEIVDIRRHPDRAARDGIFMTPALVRLEPTPIKKIVAGLGHTENLLQALDLEKITA